MKKLFLIICTFMLIGMGQQVFADILHEQRKETIKPEAKAEHKAKNELFQIGSITSLYNGIFAAKYQYAEVFKHGDFGIGTFEDLDGEMIALDGQYYQANEIGKIQAVQATQKTPFVEVTFFKSNENIEVPTASNMEVLNSTLQNKLPNKNIPYAIRIDGTFKHLSLRGVRAQQQPYPKLVEVAKQQHVFDLDNAKGTLVGFWFPQYMANIGEGGLHFHFIAEDKSLGGHVLNFEVDSVQALIQGLPKIKLYFPYSESFANASFGNGVADGEVNRKKADDM